jgi:hypothetical protein
MSLERILIGGKKLRDPRMVVQGYPSLLQTPIRTKNIQEMS